MVFDQVASLWSQIRPLAVCPSTEGVARARAWSSGLWTAKGPYPLLTGVGVLCRQGIGQVDAAMAFSDVALVDVAHVQKMFLQGKNHCGWQYRDTALLALAIPNQDVLAGE